MQIFYAKNNWWAFTAEHKVFSAVEDAEQTTSIWHTLPVLYRFPAQLWSTYMNMCFEMQTAQSCLFSSI